jgi:hypothetical protein
MATGLEKSEKMVSADSVHKDVRTLLSDEPRLVVVVVNDVSLDDVAATESAARRAGAGAGARARAVSEHRSECHMHARSHFRSQTFA